MRSRLVRWLAGLVILVVVAGAAALAAVQVRWKRHFDAPYPVIAATSSRPARRRRCWQRGRRDRRWSGADTLTNDVSSCVACHTDRGPEGALVGAPFAVDPAARLIVGKAQKPG